MDALLQQAKSITIVIFMVGNLLEVGLRLEVSEALAALRNVRFVVLSLLWCVVLGPALAVVLTKIIPLTEPYALGLVILGMAPCSPAIPVMMRKSGGSLAYMSAFMLLAYAATVLLMPFMVPLLVSGFAADPWTIAKPLLFFIAIPMVIGAAIRRAAVTIADKAAPVVKTVTGVNTLILGAVLLWLYRVEIFSAVGTYAIGSQIVFYALLGSASYLLAFGLSYDQKAPMVLGTCTRNVGPALATLLGVASAPQGAITMCILAIFLGAILSGFAAAAILKRFCAPNTPAAPHTKLAGAVTVVVIALLLPQGVSAQQATAGAAAVQPAGAGPSASELAKQTQNPIASLISFPIQTNWDLGVGDRHATSTLVNVQPVMPFGISKSTNVILRVIMPLTSQPLDVGGSRTNGLGDIILSTFFSPAAPGRVIWGVGPVMLLPTATSGTLGTEKFGVGPTAVVLTQPGNWTFGLLANQIWSTSGAIDRKDVNTTYLQPFVNYNLGSGLAVGVSAEATGNWEADQDKWSSPLLFNISKVTLLGKRPVNFAMAAGPTFGPDAGPDWRFRFQANFLFPR